MGDKFWFLKSCSLFERLTQEQIARLEQRAVAKSFARGSLIYLPTDASDSVLLVTQGRVKLYHITGDGKQAVLTFIDPGELFGEVSLVEGGEREEFAEAIEKTTLIRLPGDVVRELMDEHPSVAVGVTKLIGLRRRRIERRLKSLLFRSNRERLTHLLLELADKYGRRTSEGVELGIKLSHQDLASIIGSTRETVTVVLGELQSEGSVIVKRRQIVLVRLEELASSIDERPPVILDRPIPTRPRPAPSAAR